MTKTRKQKAKGRTRRFAWPKGAKPKKKSVIFKTRGDPASRLAGSKARNLIAKIVFPREDRKWDQTVNAAHNCIGLAAILAVGIETSEETFKQVWAQMANFAKEEDKTNERIPRAPREEI